MGRRKRNVSNWEKGGWVPKGAGDLWEYVYIFFLFVLLDERIGSLKIEAI